MLSLCGDGCGLELDSSDMEKPARARLTSNVTPEARNQRRVMPYSVSSSSLSWSDLYSETNWSRTETAIRMVAMMEEVVHSPGNSKSQ